MGAKLYVIPGSHPSKAAELMLRHKRIDFKRVDLVTALHRPVLRLLGFPGNTVPAMKVDGRRVQGTRDIARALDEIRAEPRLLPSKAVEEAERWAESELQPIPRRLAWWAVLHLDGRQRTEVTRATLADYSVGLPVGIAARTVLPIAKISARYNRASDDAVRADLAALPAKLDRADHLLSEGVIGREVLNAADYQVATSVRLLLGYEDLEGMLEGRPCANHARRVVRHYDVRFPRVFPTEWLEAAGTGGETVETGPAPA